MGTFDVAEQRFIDLTDKLGELDARVKALEEVPEPEPPARSGLADNVVMMWHHCWKGPLPWLGYPADVRDKINTITLGIAQSGGAGTGRLSYYNRFGNNLREAVAAAKDAGTSVQMGIGGSKDGGITITNPTQVTQAFDSMVGFVEAYGVTGLDIDLEPSGSSWNESSLVSLVDKLQAEYPGFVVGITPGLYGEHTAKWLSLARALGNRYQYMAPMLYDFWQAGTDELTPVALQKCQIMKDGGVSESKMVLGFMTMPHPNYKDPQGRPIASTVELTVNAHRACKAKYPGLRGLFHWEDSIDAAHLWAWSRRQG